MLVGHVYKPEHRDILFDKIVSSFIKSDIVSG